MSASRPLQDAEPGSGLTLGSLLYADSTKVRVSEDAWVALLAAVAAGNVRALHTLYMHLRGLVFTSALRITSSESSAEQVTVDVFHELWKRASCYSRADGTVIGWVMNMARARAIACMNRGREITGAEPEGLEAGNEIGSGGFEQRQQMAHVRAALAALSEEERAAVGLAYFSDATNAEISRQLDVPLGTVQSLIRSGLTKLRFALGREGFHELE
jgi:RNA polymerase sigma-70 factor, ECF subfamily